MAEVPTIPAAHPSPIVSSSATTVSTSPATAQQPQLQEIPVQQMPPTLKITELPERLEGRVISANTQTQEVRIQTEAGEVTIKTQAQLAPDTPVTLKIYINKNQMLADILLQPQESMAEEPRLTQNLALPPLKEGQTVIALLLPAMSKQQNISEKNTGSTSFLSDKNVTQIEQKNYSPEKSVINSNEGTKTPQPSSPDMIRRVLSAYLPQIFGNTTKTESPTEAETSDILDNNMILLMRAQTHAKATQNTLQNISTPVDISKPAALTSQASSALPNSLSTLLSFVTNSSEQKIISPHPPVQATTPNAPLPDMREMKILRILPPNTSPEQIKSDLIKLVVQNIQVAEIESSTSGGSPILKEKDNHFVLKAPAQIATGSIVFFKSSPLSAEQIISSLHPQTPNMQIEGKEATVQFDPLRSTSWPALDEALKILHQTDPASAQIIRHTLPSPTERLASTALFFLAVLRLGSVENWLGNQTLKSLQESGKKDIVSRLAGDFTKISDQTKQPLIDEWKAISIPFLHEEQISQMQFFVRQHHDHEHKEQGEKPATRFILNLQLSQMGDMQLDGFIHQKKFDMILRSEENLPFSIRQEIMKRFAQGLAQVHMEGGISFQVKQQNWVQIELPHQTGIIA